MESAGCVVGLSASSPVSDEVVAVGSGCSGGGGVDFGCHFLRSDVGAINSVVDLGASARIDGVDGVVSEMGGAVGLCAEDEAEDLGCHFFRSTDGVADAREETASTGRTSMMGVGAAAVTSVAMG